MDEHGTNTEPAVVPVSKKRVQECLDSAMFWVDELPKYADRQQRKADFWSIASGSLAALTGLAIFPVVDSTSALWVKVVVSACGFLAAICALVPRVKSYSELAGQARELSSRYGGVLGDLLDLAKAEPYQPKPARAVVGAFEATKGKKDSLRGLPDRATAEIARLESQIRLKVAKAAEAALEH